MTRSSIALVLFALAVAAGAQSRPASQPTSAPTSAGAVAAWVNGAPIYDKDIDAETASRLPTDADPGALEALFKRTRPEVLRAAINRRLIDALVDKDGFTLSDADYARLAEEEMRAFVSVNGMTRDELNQDLLNQRGMTLAEFLRSRTDDPAQRRIYLRREFLARRRPDDLAVTDAEVRDFYTTHRDDTFRKGPDVRASHILIDTAGKSPEEKAALRKKAEEVLALAQREGADFAALAREYSQDPTRERGGDMGWFPRRGKIAPALADAAFELSVGATSGIVESPAGYHILKLTERRDVYRTPFETAEYGIRALLRDQKTRRVFEQTALELRDVMRVEYPPGKEPTNESIHGRPTSQPGGR